MKAADLAPWAFGALGSGLTALGLWFTGAKLKDERRRDREAHDDRTLRERETASNSAAGYYEKLTGTLMKERQERETAIGHLQSEIEALRETVDDLKANLQAKDMQLAALTDQNTKLLEQIAHKDQRIEQLQGELRQEKQVQDSTRRVNQGDTK